MKKRKEALQGATDFHYENFLRRSRYTSVFLVLLAAFCVITVLNINTGNVDISIPKILKIIFLREGNKMEYNIIWKIRLPRILMAAILGGALSLSGFLLQTFFENPIAGPFVLGISSGAKMVVALAMIYFLGRFQVVSSYTLIIAAFIGSLIATRFYPFGVKTDQSYGNTFSSRYHDRLYLFSGHGFCGDFCRGLRHCQPARMEPGKLSGMNWSNVKVAAVVIGVTILITFFMSKPIGAYQLGEAYAQSMGVNIRFFRIMLILTSSVLSACVTAFAGPISFVGIAVPYLVKRSLGTSRPLIVIPATFLGGGVFCMMCDLIARVAFAPLELNISTVTSIFGAPVVIFMMLHRKKGN